MRHIIWDWNGTLYDDFPLVLRSSNAAMATVGGRPLSMTEYQRRFRRPVQEFYAEVLGREFTPEQWRAMDDAFHDTYHEIIDEADLRSGAREVLAELETSGVTQSLLSMWRHENLVPFVESIGVARHFLCMDGLQQGGGGQKEPHLREHLSQLTSLGVSQHQIVMIGDTVDDAHAAQAVGIHVVLIAGGEHTAETLESTGAPVVDTLSEAAALALD
ncbi:MAG: HAD family hydrolase [Acidimicrobiales bacterium]